MNKFQCEYLPRGGQWKYRMTADYTLDVSIYNIRPLINVDLPLRGITKKGILSLKKGMKWNGATGAVDTPNFRRGSGVHDTLYYFIRAKLLPKSARKKADKALRRICREEGMNVFRAWWVYRVVRLLGGKTI